MTIIADTSVTVDTADYPDAYVLDMSEIPEPTISEADWAQQNLSQLPAVIDMHPTREVFVWQSPDGQWWRRCGDIVASPGNKDRFRIWLWKGATVADLNWLERAIEKAKEGRFIRHGWQESKTADCYAWVLSRPLTAPEWDDRYFVVICDESACVDSYHSHESDGVCNHRVPVADRSGYDVAIEQWVDVALGPEPWKVAIGTGESLTQDEVAVFVSDLQWALADCRKLNAESDGRG